MFDVKNTIESSCMKKQTNKQTKKQKQTKNKKLHVSDTANTYVLHCGS